ncbi:MAG: hypothetical protein Dasosvirus3_28 [Dasosvirus sp.]|uniref:LicD/FKTN/FKRP nucleotidyltransferase domain-containing protein n=1 Tax=Dasosvirus sp. TaxID=2487764 RepID=A0A3G4ZVK1_9VIRU|nr:MAG: hypothetical protein Dasosvirus3_28 [Dasosvirus sp.]
MELDKKKFIEQQSKYGISVQNTKQPHFNNFLKILESCKVKYFADGGTLLGCLRFGHEIPWDDDYDIFIPKTDIDKLDNLDKLNKLQYEGFEICPEIINDPEFHDPIIDTGLGNDYQIKAVYRWNLNHYLNIICLSKKKFIKVCLHDTNKKYLATITDVFYEENATCPDIRRIYPIIRKKFRDIEINVMNNYDDYLTLLYGKNYMTDLVVCNHTLATYYDDRNKKNYVSMTMNEYKTFFKSTNKYLVFSSIGNHSVHEEWIQSSDRWTTSRTFDMVLCYYGDDDRFYKRLKEKIVGLGHIVIFRRKGLKWPNFNWYISNHNISQYQYIWVPDDDIELSERKISKMFSIMEQYPNIMVASPSTTRDSVTANGQKRIDRHRDGIKIEYTNFNENCFLLFKSCLLQNTFFRKILDATNTGYYFDILIKYCFSESEQKTSQAILHEIVARHPKRTKRNPSELDKVVPRKLHTQDSEKFLEAGITNEMLTYGVLSYSVIKN